jgi:CDP-diacylglycerol--glycerol-3-phosphate 3-phosphatidyltransferase
MWLHISYAIARVLAFLRFSPMFVTTLGIVFSVAMYWTEYTIQLLGLLILALICDGVDGSLAIITGKQSRFGELYDSIADRITEAMWLYMLAFLGLSVRYLLIIWVLGAVQEYMRTKLAGAGYSEIGVITPTERPMRAIFVAAVIITYTLGYSVMHDLAYIFIALQIISVAMIAKMARSILTP